MNNIKRLLVIIISGIICFLLQTIVFPLIPYISAVPNLMLIEVMSIGFLFGKSYGLWTGLFSGMMLDLMVSGTPGFYGLLFTWLGFLNGMLSEKLESEFIYLLYILLIANELVYHIYNFGLAFLVKKHYVFSTYITGVVIPEVVMSLLVFLVIYGILIFLAKRWDLKVNKGEVKIV